MSIPELLLWILAALVSYIIKGLCGFANTLVFTGILNFQADNVRISPVDLLIGFPGNAVLAFRERKHIRPKLCIRLSLLLLLGSTAGGLFLKYVDARIVRPLFGLLIILLSLEMLLRTKRRAKPMPDWLANILGLISGLLCGMYGVGALLGVYISQVTEDTHAFKANICTIFMVENIYRIILYACTGILTLKVLRLALILIPFMLLGLYLGMHFSGRIPEKKVRLLVIFFLIVSGIMLIVQSLL